MNKFVIAVYVDNKYGVLTRVTSMFTRRGFNIDALTVGETERPEFSRITITLSGDGYAREQLINQLRKLYNVKKVEVLSDDAIKRELMLIKVRYNSETRADIITAAEVLLGLTLLNLSFQLCDIIINSSKLTLFLVRKTKFLFPLAFRLH